MKVFLTTVLIFLVLGFGPKFKLVEASSQEWAGGRYETGFGTYYKMTLITRGGSEKLQVEDLWIGDSFFEVKALKNPANKSDLIFAKRDTVYVKWSLNFKPDKEGVSKQVVGAQKEPPFEFNGEALLGYTWKGKKKFFEIKDFRKLEKIIYP